MTTPRETAQAAYDAALAEHVDALEAMRTTHRATHGEEAHADVSVRYELARASLATTHATLMASIESENVAAATKAEE